MSATTSSWPPGCSCADHLLDAGSRGDDRVTGLDDPDGGRLDVQKGVLGLAPDVPDAVEHQPRSTNASAEPSKAGVPATSPVATCWKNVFSAVVTLLVKA
jgi:hypothetical protein